MYTILVNNNDNLLSDETPRYWAIEPVLPAPLGSDSSSGARLVISMLIWVRNVPKCLLVFLKITLLSALEPCVFPFELGGQTHNGCIFNQVQEPRSWCPTQVDELSFPVASRPCVSGDPKEQSTCSVRGPSAGLLAPKCIFPFKYLNKTYKECTFDDYTEAWCASNLDLSGNMVGWKRCGDDCNVTQPATTRLHTSCVG